MTPYYIVYNDRAVRITTIEGLLIITTTTDRVLAGKFEGVTAAALQKGLPGSVVLDQKQFANFKLNPYI
jgi:hypothetical protein